MSFEEIRTACVISYPYLWVREARRGEIEGRKQRPAAVGIRITVPNGEDLLILFPITTQPPQPDRFAVEIPEMERRRAGLDSTARLWLILDEYDEDVIGRMREFIRRRSQARGINRHR